ncbi:MAG: hypothetical protein D6732_22455 [Methanobacteriota archaeon]|nr:MAG: hypothetical protein D6732_22455 [Euryarchaeota archaeon]
MKYPISGILAIITHLWTVLDEILDVTFDFWSWAGFVGSNLAHIQIIILHKIGGKGVDMNVEEINEVVGLLNDAVKRGTMMVDPMGHRPYVPTPGRKPRPITLDRAETINTLKRRSFEAETFAWGLIGYHLLMMMGYIFQYQQIKEM